MKKKLTITVDTEVLPRAKRYALSRGVSLSSIVEETLRGLVREESRSFSSRWRGQLQADHADDPRYEALARKYL